MNDARLEAKVGAVNTMNRLLNKLDVQLRDILKDNPAKNFVGVKCKRRIDNLIRETIRNERDNSDMYNVEIEFHCADYALELHVCVTNRLREKNWVGVQNTIIIGYNDPKFTPNKNGNITVFDINTPNLRGCPKVIDGFFDCGLINLVSFDYFPDSVGGDLYCVGNPNLHRSELYKIVDRVKGEIYYRGHLKPEDKNALRMERDLVHKEIGSLNI